VELSASAGRAEPEDAISVVEHGEDGIFDQALRGSDMDGHRAARRSRRPLSCRIQIFPASSLETDKMMDRQTVFLADRFQAGILYAIETIERAND